MSSATQLGLTRVSVIFNTASHSVFTSQCPLKRMHITHPQTQTHWSHNELKSQCTRACPDYTQRLVFFSHWGIPVSSTMLMSRFGMREGGTMWPGWGEEFQCERCYPLMLQRLHELRQVVLQRWNITQTDEPCRLHCGGAQLLVLNVGHFMWYHFENTLRPRR